MRVRVPRLHLRRPRRLVDPALQLHALQAAGPVDHDDHAAAPVIDCPSVTAVEAVAVGRLHLQLHGHVITIACCDCGAAIGLLCLVCQEPLAFINDSPHRD